MATRRRSAAAQDRSDNLVWTRNTISTTIPASTSSSLHNFTQVLETYLGEEARNWTIERIIGTGVYTVPASTTPGRSYFAGLAIDVIDREAATAGGYPEPFTDENHFPWIDGRYVYADHTVPSSYASPGVNGIFTLDMRSKRKVKGSRHELRLFGFHDNGLAANPVVSIAYSALWRLR